MPHSFRSIAWRAAAAALVAAPLSAAAHAEFTSRAFVAGSAQTLTLHLEHGCNGSPITAVRLRIPDGVTEVSAVPPAGWTVHRRMRPLALAGPDGPPSPETVDELDWQGPAAAAPLTLRLRVRLPATPGATLYFKTIEQCVRGEVRWIDVPAAAGGSQLPLREPAPSLRLTAAPPERR